MAILVLCMCLYYPRDKSVHKHNLVSHVPVDIFGLGYVESEYGQTDHVTGCSDSSMCYCWIVHFSALQYVMFWVCSKCYQKKWMIKSVVLNKLRCYTVFTEQVCNLVWEEPLHPVVPLWDGLLLLLLSGMSCWFVTPVTREKSELSLC